MRPVWPCSTSPSSRRRARADVPRPATPESSRGLLARSAPRAARRRARCPARCDSRRARLATPAFFSADASPPATWPAASPSPAESGPAAMIGPIPREERRRLPPAPDRSAHRASRPRVNPRYRRLARHPSVAASAPSSSWLRDSTEISSRETPYSWSARAAAAAAAGLANNARTRGGAIGGMLLRLTMSPFRYRGGWRRPRRRLDRLPPRDRRCPASPSSMAENPSHARSPVAAA